MAFFGTGLLHTGLGQTYARRAIYANSSAGTRALGGLYFSSPIEFLFELRKPVFKYALSYLTHKPHVVVYVVKGEEPIDQ